MLKLKLPSLDIWDQETEEFSSVPEIDLEFEHSLYTISIWESRFKKPYLNEKNKTPEETMAYFYIMCQNPPMSEEDFVKRLDTKTVKKLSEYMADAMTATVITENRPQKPGKEVITNEIIYYWMVSLQIPFECQYWHLNRLMTLIRVTSIKKAEANDPKASKRAASREQLQRNNDLNELRKAQLGSKG